VRLDCGVEDAYLRSGGRGLVGVVVVKWRWGGGYCVYVYVYVGCLC
jgi:hypothetical protein